jgi:hypothetical protein
MTLSKIATRDEQALFESRLRESIKLDVKPVDLSVSSYFALDKNTNILDFFQ